MTQYENKWDSFLSGMLVMTLWGYLLHKGVKWVIPVAIVLTTVTVGLGASELLYQYIRKHHGGPDDHDDGPHAY